MKAERYLVDSNILIYYITDRAMLTAEIIDILKGYNNRIYVPSKCMEELIYLRQSERIKVEQWKSAADVIGYVTDELGFEIKYVAKEHLQTLASLPLIPGHKDPTDRIIVAQAITEKMPIVSSDRKFHEYRRVKLKFIFNKK